MCISPSAARCKNCTTAIANIHTYIHTHAHSYIYVYMCINMYVHLCRKMPKLRLSNSVYSYIHTHVHSHTYIYVYICIYTSAARCKSCASASASFWSNSSRVWCTSCSALPNSCASANAASNSRDCDMTQLYVSRGVCVCVTCRGTCPAAPCPVGARV